MYIQTWFKSIGKWYLDLVVKLFSWLLLVKLGYYSVQVPISTKFSMYWSIWRHSYTRYNKYSEYCSKKNVPARWLRQISNVGAIENEVISVTG